MTCVQYARQKNGRERVPPFRDSKEGHAKLEASWPILRAAFSSCELQGQTGSNDVVVEVNWAVPLLFLSFLQTPCPRATYCWRSARKAHSTRRRGARTQKRPKHKEGQIRVFQKRERATKVTKNKAKIRLPKKEAKDKGNPKKPSFVLKRHTKVSKNNPKNSVC